MHPTSRAAFYGKLLSEKTGKVQFTVYLKQRRTKAEAFLSDIFAAVIIALLHNRERLLIPNY